MDERTIPPTAGLLSRLDGLERANRRLTLLTLASCALAGIAWTTAGESAAMAADAPATAPATAPADQDAGRVVTAKRFVVLDDHGREAVELVDHHIKFYDDTGKVRVQLGAFALGECSAADDQGAATVGQPTFLAALEFLDDAGRTRASFNSNPNGWSTLAFFDDAGAGCANLNVSDDCRSGLAIGGGERGFGRFWTDEGDEVNIDLIGRDEKVRWTTR